MNNVAVISSESINPRPIQIGPSVITVRRSGRLPCQIIKVQKTYIAIFIDNVFQSRKDSFSVSTIIEFNILEIGTF